MTEAQRIAAELTPEHRAALIELDDGLGTDDLWDVPDGLVEYDEAWDEETGDEWYWWTLTEIGAQVVAVLRGEA